MFKFYFKNIVFKIFSYKAKRNIKRGLSNNDFEVEMQSIHIRKGTKNETFLMMKRMILSLSICMWLNKNVKLSALWEVACKIVIFYSVKLLGFRPFLRPYYGELFDEIIDVYKLRG